LRALSSHQIRHLLPEAPGYLFFDICFLRDPLDRLRSFYDYFRQKPNPDDPMSALANQCELGDFVAGMIEQHSLFIKNNQVNLLACAGDSDEPDERDLALAIRRMLATSFLGVVDCFEQSAAAGTAALRSAFPELDCARPAVNVSGGMQGTVADRTEALRKACRPEVYEELLRITALDRRLVDRARMEVWGRHLACQGRSHHPASATRSQQRGSGSPVPRVLTARRFFNLVAYWPTLIGSGRATLFDADYYGGSFLDFLLKGAFEGRQPHPLFDPAFYLRKYPDIAASCVNPWCHYLKYGGEELRQPHPLFDPVFYLDRNPDVRGARLNPLLHYINHGAAEDRKPHPLFDPIHYRASSRQSSKNPLVHFLSCGAAVASPHPLFDCAAYLDAHPEIAERDLNPLVHYLNSGMAPGPLPSIEGSRVVQMDIQDVQLAVHVANADPGSFPDNAAVVWQDAEGITHWIAEPQQLPFLRALGVDQIRAQANATPSA
jgi:hypothetical protein